MGAWERGQVAPTHPAWFEQPQKEDTPELLSSVPPSGSRAAWSRGRAPAARERPRASLQPAPAAPTRPVAPQGLPPAPAADPPLPAARISCPFPNSPLVSPPPDVCSGGGGGPLPGTPPSIVRGPAGLAVAPGSPSANAEAAAPQAGFRSSAAGAARESLRHPSGSPGMEALSFLQFLREERQAQSD